MEGLGTRLRVVSVGEGGIKAVAAQRVNTLWKGRVWEGGGGGGGEGYLEVEPDCRKDEAFTCGRRSVRHHQKRGMTLFLSC